jgi:hypothetical protein
MMWKMKRQSVVAVVLLLMIPVVSMLGGLLFSKINPEIAAGHPNYARNFHLLSLLKNMSFLASGAVVGILWLLVCFLVIRSKERSLLWMGCAALGPFGLAILAILNDKVKSCTHCPELAETRTQTVFGVGNPVARILFIGEAPGADEDAQGEDDRPPGQGGAARARGRGCMGPERRQRRAGLAR